MYNLPNTVYLSKLGTMNVIRHLKGKHEEALGLIDSILDDMCFTYKEVATR